MTQATMETATLRHYADRLARHLVGPYSRRSEILDEVLDGLQCAAEGKLEACPDLEEAARRAIQEWGEPREVAREYNNATLRLSANRLALRAVCTLPLLAAAWAFAVLAGPAAPWPHHPPMLVFGVSIAALGGALCAAGGLIALMRGTGIRAAVAPNFDAAATSTIAAITGLILVLSAPVILLLNRGITHPESLNWYLVSLPSVLTLLAAAYFGASLKRFLFVVRSTAHAA